MGAAAAAAAKTLKIITRGRTRKRTTKCAHDTTRNFVIFIPFFSLPLFFLLDRRKLNR